MAESLMVSQATQDTVNNKQNSSDNALNTTAKTVIGAINEHESDISTLNSKIENYKILRTRQAFSLTTGDAVLHFPGSGTANLGLAEKDVTTLVPSGAVYIACIPGQASRANGIDVAFALMRDSSTGTVRILGTPNQTYTVNVDILYRYPAT